MNVPNIGPRGRRRRCLSGLLLLALTAGIGLALVAAGLPRWWRLALVMPFWLAALGVFQARGMT